MIEKNYKIQSQNNYNINCDLYIPKNFKKIIIAIHGFGGDKNSNVITTLANELYKYDIGTIAFDLPGHGTSEVDGNQFSVKNCVNDLLSVEKYLKEKYNKPIGIFATSFGAYITLIRMAKYEYEYCNIILRCPAINMYEIYKNKIIPIPIENYKKIGYCELGYERKINIYYDYFEELEKYNVDNMITKLDSKIIIIHGTEDEMAPINDSIKFANKFKENVILEKVIGADHRFKKDGELEKIINISKKYIIEDDNIK